MASNSEITVRPARADDVGALSALLDQIIKRGGTTACQTPLSEAEFSTNFLETPTLMSCFVACLEEGMLLGFQHLQSHSKLADDWGYRHI